MSAEVRNSEFRALRKTHGVPYHGTKYAILVE